MSKWPPGFQKIDLMLIKFLMFSPSIYADHTEESVLPQVICALVRLCDGSVKNDNSPDINAQVLLPVREEAGRSLFALNTSTTT